MTNPESHVQVVNFVQVACSRPQLYTANGTLAELYALLIGYDIGSRAHRPLPDVDQSASLTLAWLHERADDPRNVVAELLEAHATDESALQAVFEFASTLPPAPSDSKTPS